MHTHRSPSQGIAIDRKQREAIYEELTDHLSGLGDVHIHMQQGDYAAAQRLRSEFEEAACWTTSAGPRTSPPSRSS
jgi:hypothetical protein